jgi:dolichyl-phosphate-mannose--protein O-mannosyl transferase
MRGKALLSNSILASWILGYFVSFVPFLLTRRAVYISDYAVSYFFGVFVMMATINVRFSPVVKGFALFVVAAGAVGGFLIWSPLVYGLKIPDLPFLVWNKRWLV